MKNLTASGRRVPPTQYYRRPELTRIGVTVGSLTLINNDLRVNYGGRIFPAGRFRCRCGKEVVRAFHTFSRTKHPSCGCEGHKTRKEQCVLIPSGTRFGRWTVIENGLYKLHRNTTSRACRVRCDCGLEAIHWSSTLTSGKSRSCGCSYRKYPQGIENLWYKLHSKQKVRKNYHLTISEMKLLMQRSCFYCGDRPSNIFRHPYNEQTLYYSGIDRIDPNGDYVRGNVVPCCWTCNRMKSALPLADFLGIIERIHAHGYSVAKVHHQAAELFASNVLQVVDS